MSWLSKFVRPKINALMGKRDVPENLWDKCSACEKMIFRKDLVANFHVCPHCNHHMRVNSSDRLKMMFDGESYESGAVPYVQVDPLKFKDLKKYSDRLKAARINPEASTEAIQVGEGRIEGVMTVVAAFDFSFIGGSMGMFVGEAIIAAAERAIGLKAPLVVVPSSGGARMQEGILSLMQMARTTVAVEMLKDAHLPYITVLTDPTTGGVSASFAMLGDITMAEAGAIIGFTGARVIEQTIRQKLPEGFQKAEYLLDHGMVDLIVHRHELKKKLGAILGILHRK